jgi:hypothetical protein
MDFEEFCAAALSVHQLEALDHWEQHARCAFELFDKDGNRAIVIEELASVSWYFFKKFSCGDVTFQSFIRTVTTVSGAWPWSLHSRSCCS